MTLEFVVLLLSFTCMDAQSTSQVEAGWDDSQW